MSSLHRIIFIRYVAAVVRRVKKTLTLNKKEEFIMQATPNAINDDHEFQKMLNFTVKSGFTAAFLFVVEAVSTFFFTKFNNLGFSYQVPDVFRLVTAGLGFIFTALTCVGIIGTAHAALAEKGKESVVEELKRKKN
jgi:hypothetical protein